MARFFSHKSVPFFLGVKMVLTLTVLVNAATIVDTIYQKSGERGSHLTVTNNLLSVDKGVSKSASGLSAVGTSCGNNKTFTGTPGTANTAVIAGNIIYTVQVNTTATAPTSTCFTVTLVLSSNTGSQTSYGPVYIATGSSVTAGQTISCKFDVGTSYPAPPYSFKVTVQ